MLLSAQLEIQSYYFCSAPDIPKTNLTLNTLRAYTTSQDIITAALALESQSQFLTHGPHWIYRVVIDAGCILLSTLHSTAAPPHTPSDAADALVLRVVSAARHCSVSEADLPTRSTVILETFWSIRNLVSKSEVAVGAWPERLGAAVSYWCLSHFRDALQEAKKSTEGLNKGLEAFRMLSLLRMTLIPY